MVVVASRSGYIYLPKKCGTPASYYYHDDVPQNKHGVALRACSSVVVQYSPRNANSAFYYASAEHVFRMCYQRQHECITVRPFSRINSLRYLLRSLQRDTASHTDGFRSVSRLIRHWAIPSNSIITYRLSKPHAAKRFFPS